MSQTVSRLPRLTWAGDNSQAAVPHLKGRKWTWPWASTRERTSATNLPGAGGSSRRRVGGRGVRSSGTISFAGEPPPDPGRGPSGGYRSAPAAAAERRSRGELSAQRAEGMALWRWNAWSTRLRGRRWSGGSRRSRLVASDWRRPRPCSDCPRPTAPGSPRCCSGSRANRMTCHAGFEVACEPDQTHALVGQSQLLLLQRKRNFIAGFENLLADAGSGLDALLDQLLIEDAT